MKKGNKPNPTLAFLKQEITGLTVQAVKPVMEQPLVEQSVDGNVDVARLIQYNPIGDAPLGVPYTVVTGDFQRYEGQIVQVPIAVLKIDDNVRSQIDKDDDYYSLVSTIRTKGLLQNLVAQLSVSPNELLLTAGHRRLSAAEEAGLRNVPVLILGSIDKQTRIRLQLVENVQRVGLTPLEIGNAYSELVVLGDTVEEIAEAFKCDKKTVQRYINLTHWPEDAIRVLKENPKQFSTDFLFNKIPGVIRSSPTMLTQYLIEEVEKAKAAASGATPPARKAIAETDADLTRWNQAAGQSLGVPVKLSGSREKLRITIRCSGDDEVQKVLEKLGIPFD
jgi:ParB family chromosome partitioning protein